MTGSDSSGRDSSVHESVTLASIIRKAREAAGLSVRQLAPLVGAHHSVLSRIEASEVTRPSPEMVQNIATALELDPSELLAFIGVKPTLPEPRAYFRRAYGMSESEATEAAEIIANLRAHQQEQQATDNQQDNKGGGTHDNTNQGSDEDTD